MKVHTSPSPKNFVNIFFKFTFLAFVLIFHIKFFVGRNGYYKWYTVVFKPVEEASWLKKKKKLIFTFSIRKEYNIISELGIRNFSFVPTVYIYQFLLNSNQRFVNIIFHSC